MNIQRVSMINTLKKTLLPCVGAVMLTTSAMAAGQPVKQDKDNVDKVEIVAQNDKQKTLSSAEKTVYTVLGWGFFAFMGLLGSVGLINSAIAKKDTTKQD